MERLHMAQVAKILVISLFLAMIPFISASLRQSYLYFLLNLFIVVLAIESGILSSFSEPSEGGNNKPMVVIAPSLYQPTLGLEKETTTCVSSCVFEEQKEVIMKTLTSRLTPEKAVHVTKAQKLKRCLSRPSLFFVGGGENAESGSATSEKDSSMFEEAVNVGRGGDLSKQELFMRAEEFIGNFYNQLKMQREESWKKIHGFYHM